MTVHVTILLRSSITSYVGSGDLVVPPGPQNRSAQLTSPAESQSMETFDPPKPADPELTRIMRERWQTLYGAKKLKGVALLREVERLNELQAQRLFDIRLKH